VRPDVLRETALPCVQYSLLLVASCAYLRGDHRLEAQEGPAVRGLRLLRGFRHSLESWRVSPGDGAPTVHRLGCSLPLGLLPSCGGFCRMKLLKCKRPFQPFEKPGPLWSPVLSVLLGGEVFLNGLFLNDRRSIGVSGRVLCPPSGLLGARASRRTPLLQKGSLSTRALRLLVKASPHTHSTFPCGCALPTVPHCPH